MNTRILLVDSHENVRNSLALFLEVSDEFEMVAEASDGETALALCDTLLPDLVITEIWLPKLDGIRLTSKIRQAYPHIRVLALDITQDIKVIEAVLKAGASCYLFKEVSIDELTQTIREIVRTTKPPLNAYA